MIEPSWVGRRVSVRRVVERREDGGLLFGDVVGDLVALDEQIAVVESRAGLVEVPIGLVAAARLAPPSTADELALEAVAARGLRPVETEELDGWLLRADPGFTHRANSVLPLRQLRIPLPEALRRAHDWYARRGLPLQIQVPARARRLLDADLGERGWEPVLHTQVLAARLDAVRPPGGHTAGPAVAVDDEPDAGWLAVYRGGAGLAPAGRALLLRHDRVGFASIRAEGRTVAVGRGAVDGQWLGVMAVDVAPGHRRRGLAAQLMAALHGWGAGQGAARSYLQVEAGNVPALALYHKLGYWLHHDYRYRIEPPPQDGP